MQKIVEAHPLIFKRWSYVSAAIHQATSDGIDVKVIHRPGMPVRERSTCALVNITSGLELGVYESSVNEGLAGLLERVFYVADGAGGWKRPPVPEKGFWRLVMRKAVAGSYFYPVARLSVDEFLSRYKGAKLTTYTRARDELEIFGLSPKKHCFVGAFVKDERQKFGKAPRLIRPFSPVFNLAFGTFVYPLEKCVYGAIDKLYRGPTVTKGLNGSEVAQALRSKWDEFGDPVCIITDMERFDQHCSEDPMAWVEWLCCQSLYKTNCEMSEFRRLWKHTVHTRGMVLCDDGVVPYSVHGTLNSGLSSTSLCGVAIVCYLLRAYCVSVGLRHQLISAGDDTNIIIDRCDLAKMSGLPAFCLRAGFTVKIDGVVDVFERIDFCQSRPVWDGSQWVMCRNPSVVTTKDLLVSKLFRNSGDRRAYMGAIADCGISLTGGLPVMQSFYLMLKRNAMGAAPCALERNGFYYLSRNMSRIISEPSDESRISFYKAFGINIWRQLELERYYDHVVVSGEQLVSEIDCRSSLISRDLFHAFTEEN